MLIATPAGRFLNAGSLRMGMLTRFFFAFLEGLLEPSHSDDPEIFGMFGRPYDGDGMMTDEQYREYMAAHDGNQWGKWCVQPSHRHVGQWWR